MDVHGQLVSYIIYVLFVASQSAMLTEFREWAAGFTDRFGCVWVDFESKEKTRYPKRSSKVLRQTMQHLIKSAD